MAETISNAIDPRTLVAPELLPGLDLFPALELTEAGLALMRDPARISTLQRPLTPAQAAVSREERFVPGAAGAPDVRVLLYTPPGEARVRPAYLHIHGGGYVLGSAEINDASNRTIASEQDCIVLSVDYRLAPETRFPGALDDCFAALVWLHDAADALGIDRERIAVGGESAGGGHAAALALRARDAGGPAIGFLMLESPMLDDRTGSPGDPVRHAATWSAAQNRFGWGALLGVEPGSDAVPEGAAPARAADVAGLPPTLITVGAVDLFADEDIAFARRLVGAGVPTELHVIPGAFHGFGISGDATPQILALDRYRRDALTRAFAPTRGQD